MKGNFPFRFWCHKVLPLVYDDSISYYEFICKIAKLVNDISEHNVQQDEAISNNNAYIVKLDNEVHNDIVPRLENEISGLETAIANEESARIRGDYEIGERLNNDEENITDLHRQIRWVAKRFGALPYDKEHNYNVGDFCLFNDVGSSEDSTLIYGNIYRCKESTTGEFDSTKWEMINLLQFVEKIWSKTLEPFADKYDETHTWNVNDIVLYGGDEVYGNTGGMPIIYRCINQTTGAFNYNDWTPLRFSWILDKALEAESVANDLDYMKISIARNYFGYEEEETQYYSEGTYVWYQDLLYKALNDITVDSPSVLPPDQNSDWTIVTLASDVALLKSHSDFIDDNLNRLDRTVSYGFSSIANNYQSYSGAPLFYPKGSYVWYSDILYKANADVTVDSASVLPPSQNSKWDTVQLTNEIGSGENEQSHNGIFRGKDLTNVYTIEQMYAMIHDGTFSDLFLGDYFTKAITTDIYTVFSGSAFEQGVTYYEQGGTLTARTYTATSDTEPQSGKVYCTKQSKTENITLMFAGFDYYYNMGDTALTKHHAVLIPRTAFATSAKMNNTNTTVGGYYNSEMHQTTLPCYAASLKTALNNHLLSHKTILPNDINASIPSMAGAGITGAATNWGWETTELQLMNEVQVFGTTVWSSSAYDVGCDNKLLPVFKFINPIQFKHSTYWLRSVASSAYFAHCHAYGYAGLNSASSAHAVRPLILFG